MERTLRSLLLAALALVVALLLPATALAQTAPLNYRVEAFTADSGTHTARADQAEAAYSAYRTTVQAPGAPWLRLTFSAAELGRASYLTVTSLQDGARQRLDAETLAQWEATSAYFNGDAVEVELFVARGDAGVSASIREILVGTVGAPEAASQCGSVDDRVDSTDPRTGRLLSVGCTAWLIADGRFVSAGHCLSPFSANTVQFNVPKSLSNGSLQHPGPEDQYVVDDSSIESVNGGVGNDWGVFEVFDNAETGLQPLQAQGAFFTLAQDLGPATIRITGFGVDSGADNQTLQTHAGPNVGSGGTTMAYQADTQGGNSGSPVIDEATGRAVGVHTHGGCSTSGGSGTNKGTSTFNTAFWEALDVGGFAATIPMRARASFDGRRWFADLVWRGADGGQVDVFVDGAVVATTSDDGAFSYGLERQAAGQTYALQICEPETGGACSDVVSLSVPESGAPAVASAQGEMRTAVLGAHPNPFSTSTSIRYHLAEAGAVELAVYNTLGQRVALLADGQQEGGAHEALFEASALPGGVYFYRLRAGAVVESGRLLVVR